MHFLSIQSKLIVFSAFRHLIIRSFQKEPLRKNEYKQKTNAVYCQHSLFHFAEHMIRYQSALALLSRHKETISITPQKQKLN
jgi:hypothetical protein